MPAIETLSDAQKTSVLDGIGATKLIERVTFDGTLGTHTFTVPTGYRHLQVIAELRSARAGQATSYAFFRFNGDTAANYAFQRQTSDTAVTASTPSNAQNGLFVDLLGATGQADETTLVDIMVANYLGTVANQRAHWRTSMRKNATTDLELYDCAGWWLAKAAITSLTVLEGNAANFTNGSYAELWGIR